jgi:hypothetical protein
VPDLGRDMDESTLRVFLGKMPTHEIIECLIGTLHAIYDTDEKFHEITMHIVTWVQLFEIQSGRDDLRQYKEERQKKLFQELLKNKTGAEWKRDDVFEATFKDWKDSGLSFNQWVVG